ncbi:MAG TPA: hypothetical protein VEB68_01000 [Croceibacterium sp.]|nr:hypothetical protein [Croceibacterium sp.]
MSLADKLSRPARHPGDPAVLESGPSSLGAADKAAKGLGWFSLALGAAELLAAPRVTRSLGVAGHEGLVRAFGVREIVAGVTSLSVDKRPGIWSRVAGDALDLGALALAFAGSRKKGNVALALAAVAGVMLVDVVTARALDRRHRREGPPKDFSDRSGWPNGLERSRGAAKDFGKPTAVRAPDAAPRSEASAASRQLEAIH